MGCLLIFGADNFLIPSMLCILAALSLLRRPMEKTLREEGADV